MVELDKIIKESKPTARFGKAQLYRELDDSHIAGVVASRLVALIDEQKVLQQFGGQLGRAILGPFDTDEETEKDQKTNYLSCGLALIRVLLKHKILVKRLEPVVKGVDENGEKIYKRMLPGNKGLILTQWVLHVKSRDLVWYFYITYLPRINDRSVPTAFKPPKRKEFYDFHGGHLVSKLRKDFVKFFNYDQIPLVYEQINQLQSIAWRVNYDVYQAVKANEDKYISENLEKNREFNSTMIQASDRLFTTVAGKKVLANRGFFYYWHLDFRGRYYCAAHFLSPQGTKLSKGLLYFEKKKRIGKFGLRWLKIHLANSWGENKLSLDDRVKWVDANIEDILYCGENPNDTYSYWSRAAEKECFLAACIELHKAYQLSKPESFKSGLPIGIDFTCSGLMIMSYLTRCHVVGKLVNLADQKHIGDVYQFVADKIDWDSLEFWKHHKQLQRWLCKRPVMSRYYSAGWKTISEALFKDTNNEGIPSTKEDCEELAKLIVKACDEHLPGPSKLMKLFIEMGTVLAKQGKHLAFVNPHSKFPFIQACTYPNRSRLTWKDEKGKRINLRFITGEGDRIRLHGPKSVTTGSAANCVHFMDAMVVSKLLSVAAAKKYDVVTTHDCMYCSPSDVQKVFKDVRQVMYDLFGAEDFLQQMCDFVGIKNTIKYGDLDVNHIKINQYCVA